MQPVLNAEEMRRADKSAVDLGIPELVLMENAARGTCDLLEVIAREELPPDPVIVVFCGMGNNGGDGVAIVRHALNRRMNALAVLVGKREKASPSMKTQLRILEAIDPSSIVSFETFRRRRQRTDIVVDALLGTGFTGTPRSPISLAIKWINEHAPSVLAVDIPSGVDATSGMASGVAIRADWTATMGALKPGLLLGTGRDHAGDISVVDIGAPRFVYHETRLWLLDAEASQARVPAIHPDRHKYDRGKSLVVGSSMGMVGAGILAATSALRSGAGLSILAAPAAALAQSPHSIPPEIMLRHVGDAGPSAEALQDLLLGSELFDSIACGPGLGRTREAAEIVRLLLGECEVPLILDADALHPFAGSFKELKRRMCPLVITPHHGEMAHLLGVSRQEVAHDPCTVARDVARAVDGVVVLKGAPTVVASPDGQVWINGAGNPGMATAGSGDVLTGTLAALTARRDDVFDAVLAGVFLHSHAADRAARGRGMHGMTAGDIVHELPEAARDLYGAR